MNGIIINTEAAKQAACENPTIKELLSKGWRKSALYEYQDKDGNPLYWRIRLDPPVGSNEKKWVRPFSYNRNTKKWELKEPEFIKGTKPLYLLPSIVENSDLVVYLVEGEKCVNALSRLKMLATTSGSATSAGNADWSCLQNRKVIIWPDNDEEGLQYAREVTQILLKLGCNIQWIDLEKLQLPKGGDCVDWLAANLNATKVDLENLRLNMPSVDKFPEWPNVIPLNTPNLPRINLSNLPGWLGDFAGALSAFSETPIELAAGLALGSCSAAVARCIQVNVKDGYREPCNLWIVVALPSGNRKSSVQSAATEPLSNWEQQQAQLLKPDIRRVTSEHKTMEARIKEKRNEVARAKDANDAKALMLEIATLENELPEIPVIPQLWTSDTTPERLGTLLADHNERIAWLSSEGGIFDLLEGRYSNIPNLDLILKSHSGDPERIHRTSRPSVFLQNPLSSICLSPQPDILRGLASKPGFRGRGLIARFLYLLPSSPLGYRTLKTVSIPSDIYKAYSVGLTAILNWSSPTNKNNLTNNHVLQLSSEAYTEWLEFAQVIEHKMRPGADMEHFTDWAGKAPGAAIRLSGVLHCAKHVHETPWEIQVSVETMKNALDIMSVFAQHSLAALDLMGADVSLANARKIWNWIEQNHKYTFTVTDLFNALRSTFPRVNYLVDPLSVLEERGYIKIEEQATDGRGRKPSPLVRVRPDIIGGQK